MIWGDSHAAALSGGLRQLVPGLGPFMATGCPPLPDNDFVQRPSCRRINDVLGELASVRAARLFLHANWSEYRKLDPARALSVTLARIRRTSPEIEIIVTGPVPLWSPSLPAHMLRTGASLRENASQDLLNPAFDRWSAPDAALETVAKNAGASFFSPPRLFCHGECCPVTTSLRGFTELVTWDYGHLTGAGALLLSRELLSHVGNP